jgi:hypothetical protein
MPAQQRAWNDRYNDLVDYKNEHGHASPPVSEGQLGPWCHNQRCIFQNQFRSTGKATLFQYQIDKLVEIDFQFNLPRGGHAQQRAWNDRYNDLVDYKNEHGHASPPQREGQLGRWCKNQRSRFQTNFSSTGEATIVQYRINKLVEIGFQFKPRPDKRTLQRANLPARPDLQTWSDMPALPEMPTLPDMQTLSSLAIVPDCVHPVLNVIAV